MKKFILFFLLILFISGCVETIIYEDKTPAITSPVPKEAVKEEMPKDVTKEEVTGSICGDNVCQEGESCFNCPNECGFCKKEIGEFCSDSTDCKSNRCINSVCRKLETYCGDGICQPSENEDCPDCPLNCISDEFCNSKVDIFYLGFNPEKSLMGLTYEYQNQAFNCLKNYFGYFPSRRIGYQITKAPFICSVNGSVCGGGHSADTYKVNAEGFFGGIDYGESYVTNIDNIKMDIHETTHVFTMNAMGMVPLWFNEGVSEYITEKLNCSPNQQKKQYTYNYTLILYKDLKEGKTSWEFSNTSEFGQKYHRRLEDPHTIGTLFFIGLSEDYHCDLSCLQKIFGRLHVHRETFKDKNVYGYYVTNKVIKEKVDEVLEKDTRPLFDLLKINLI